MSVADSDSRLRDAPTLGGSPGLKPSQNAATSELVWLDGDVLACACPKCQAPMSIRLWLMVADCWRCGTSIELTEEQEREALRLLRVREEIRQSSAQLDLGAAREDLAGAKIALPSLAPPPSAPAVPRPAAPAPSPVAPAAVEVKPVPSKPAQPPAKARTTTPAAPVGPAAPTQPAWRMPVSRPSAPGAPSAPAGRVAAAHKPVGVRARLHQISSLGEARLWARDAWKDLPCWLISLIFHMILIILLGVWWLPETDPPRRLVLALQANSLDQEGDALLEEPSDGIEFDDPGLPIDTSESQSELVGEVDEEMPEIFPEPTEPPASTLLDSTLPEIPVVGGEPGSILAGRDPRLRSQLVQREGGTILTEAAVKRGLEWLARHQNYDGSWSLDRFNEAGDCNGQCTHGGISSDVSATALALLPFLGAGQTQVQGDYQDLVAKGLRWLVDHQGYDGDLRTPGQGMMYAHGQATIALCEAYAMTQSEKLHEPAQKAIDFIVKAQHPSGGWRYNPGDAGDTSVVGWQMMALRSAKMAYLKVPQSVFDKASRFLDMVQTDSSLGVYTYVPGGFASPTMTAEGLLCRQYSGWKRDNPTLTSGVDWLLNTSPPSRNYTYMYYWYYATQVMHHMGGDRWRNWNDSLKAILVDLQETEGHMAGSWTPTVEHDPRGGRVYMTALAVCTLEVYYRHLPLYKSEAVSDNGQERSTNRKASKLFKGKNRRNNRDD